MSKSPFNKNKNLIIKFAVLILILVAGASTLFFFKQSQDIRQQAWLGSNDVGSSCLNGSCEKSAKKTAIFTSSQDVYRIDLTNYDWKETDIPETSSKKNQDPSFFIFRNKFGFATIFLNAVPLKDDYSTYDIKQLSKALEKQEINKSKLAANYLGKEILNLERGPVIRYKFQEKILGQDTTYYEYVILGKKYYLEAEVRSTETTLAKNRVKSFLNSLEFVSETKNVKGVSSEKEVFGESQITELVKPSVANVLYLYCKEIKLSPNVSSTYVKKSYSFCGGSYGSGFIVNESGTVATNGHVVSSHQEEDLVGGISSGNKAIISFLIDYVRDVLLYQQGITLTQEEAYNFTADVLRNPSGAQALLKSVYELFDKNAISIVPTTEKYYVNLGSDAFEFSDKQLTPTNIENFTKTNTALFAATKIDTDYANMFSKAVLFDKEKPVGSDVALLQIDDTKAYAYPSLKLGNVESLKSGDPILVLGFPGIVSGSKSSPSLLDYSSSSTQATVTRGIVSSIKKDIQGNNLIQTDAVIGHGNSGGPAFNENGEVVGIATYGIADDVGSFNFLRDINDLENLAKKNEINIENSGNKTYQNWETALDLYWSKHFTKSLGFLKEVETSYPIHPTAQNIVDSAKEEIKDGKDVDLLFGLQKTMVYIIAALLTAIVILLTIIAIVKSRAKKQENNILSQPIEPNPNRVNPEIAINDTVVPAPATTQQQIVTEQQNISQKTITQQPIATQQPLTETTATSMEQKVENTPIK